MKYYCVTRNVEGNVTGVNHDVAMIETRENITGRHTWNSSKKYDEAMNHPFSFPSEEAQEYFKAYCKRQFEKNHKPRGLFINDFEPFDLEKCPEIKFFVTKKRVKKVDILSPITTNTFGMFHGVISKRLFNLLIGYRLPPMNVIPVYIAEFKETYYWIGVGGVREWDQSDDYDLLNVGGVGGAIYFSEALVNEIKDAKITGLCISQKSIEC